MNAALAIMNQGWVGSTIGLIGLATAFMLYRFTRSVARPVYQERSLRLIGSDEAALPSDIEVLFRGKAVPRLTRTFVVLWNSGNVLIRGGDIVKEDPIRIEVSNDSEILDVSVVKATKLANKFSAHIDSELACRAIIEFDYLDPQDGATIQILHTSSNLHPRLLGTIRGVPSGITPLGKILRTQGSVKLFGITISIIPFIYGVLLMGLIAIIAGLFFPDKFLSTFYEINSFTDLANRPSLVGMGLLYALPCALFLWIRRRRFSTRLYAQELED